MDNNSTIYLDWWNKNSVKYLSQFFRLAKYLIRISTGFFSIQGYNLVRPAITRKRLHIMVGYDERSKRDLKKKLIEEIMEDLSAWHEPRRQTVIELVSKLKAGEFKLIDARARQQDHAKIYIIDDDYVIGGSTNLTMSGLLYNYEGDLALDKSKEPERVAEWCNYFEKYWTDPNTYDLSEDLLKRLEEWLKLRDPYDIYLKTIMALVSEDTPSSPRPNYKTPVEFQMVVVNRALRQLNDWKGAMIVASTGLGKTVMATHIAYELRTKNEILNLMVLSPASIKGEWKKRLRSAGLPETVYTRNVLDSPKRGENNKHVLNEILEALNDIDEKWLVIIDESQYFRNRKRASGEERRSFTRLIETINEKKCFVLLLTATPFATEVENINHQLLLLPHTNPDSNVKQTMFPWLEQKELYEHSWIVDNVKDLIELPVGTVINTPYVAENFALSDEQGNDYLLFGEQRRYIPKIQLSKIEIPVILEQAMTEALDSGYFQHDLLKFMRRGKWQRSETNIVKEAIVSWASSPLALQNVIEKTIRQEGGYDVPFKRIWEERYEYLSPILERLKQLRYLDDQKFMTLYALIKEFRQAHSKILIFTERLPTAVYLEQGLASLFPELRVANVIKYQDDDFVQKERTEVEHMMIGFAPQANAPEDGEIPEDKYDVFITTDAYSEGVNLQDANVVINYDIAWTADTIIQRAGRILRFWPTPRKVYLYLFASLQFEEQYESIYTYQPSAKLKERLLRLIDRTKEAEKFTDIPIIPEDTQRFETLRGLSSMKIENLGEISPRELEGLQFDQVSPFLIHLTELRKNLSYAKHIPDDISSSLVSKRIKKPYLYVLLKYKGLYYWMLYDIHSKDIIKIKEDELLDKIKCDKQTKLAIIDPEEIEEERQVCIKLWAKKQKLESEMQHVLHICTLYLQPVLEEKGVEHLLEDNLL